MPSLVANPERIRLAMLGMVDGNGHPYSWSAILNGRYDAAAMAPKIKIPALFVFAENDEVTPMENGAALARAWGGPQKTLTLAGARHYGIERRQEFWNAVTEFLSAIDSPSSRREGYAGQLGVQP